MAEGTLIEWARHPVTGKGATWNIVTGCSVVSPGCTNCYAMKLAGTRLKHHPSREGLTRDSKAGPVWNGQVRFNEQWLTQPLGWTKPHGIFVAAHGDLFADGVTDAELDRIFAVMALCQQHVFYVLTKRPERMRDYLSRPAGNGKQDIRNHLAWEVLPKVMNAWAPEWKAEDITGRHRSRGIAAFTTWPLPNVWLGVSVEDQTRADERIPVLLDTPAAIRFISAEPLLGPVDIDCPDVDWMLFPEGNGIVGDRLKIDWVIAGGESGSDARPSHPDWFRALRDQCARACIPYFFKQWGSWGRARPVPSGTEGHYAIASKGPLTGFWPASVIQVDEYPRQINLFGGASVLEKVGKKAAGRRLDGVEHTAWPAFEPFARSERKRSGEPISGSEGPEATLVEGEA